MSYITKTNLSLGPQFGSQMSQYAGLLALSKHLGSEIRFVQQALTAFRGVKLFDAFNLDQLIVESNQQQYSTYTLKDVVCDEQVFKLDSNKNWDIQGWFHLYHYWNDYEDLVKDTFTFKQEILDQATKQIETIRDAESYPIVSVHFRRGDYLQVASLNLTLEYYNEAISFFIEKLGYFKLVVFSDDIEWCKGVFEGEAVYFSEGNTNYVDMCMMTLCDHNIVANSSFSWWGAYLNKNTDKIIICPENYIGPSDKESQFINKNYYPKDWIALKLNYTK